MPRPGDRLSPFLRVASREPIAFARAVTEALDSAWQTAWDAIVDAYDWDRLAERIEHLLEGSREN